MPVFPFTVIPRTGFDFARFGETRAQLHERLGEPAEGWQRDLAEPIVTDLYLPSLVSFDYDDADRLVFIEVINDEGEVLYEGVPLLNRPQDEVVAAVTELVGHPPIEKVGVFAFPELGLRLWSNYDGELDDYAIKGVGLVPEETNRHFTRK